MLTNGLLYTLGVNTTLYNDWVTLHARISLRIRCIKETNTKTLLGHSLKLCQYIERGKT